MVELLKITFFKNLPQAEPTVKKHKPVQKRLGNLFHDEIDHGSIGPQDEGAGQPLRQLDQEHHGVISRVNKLVLQSVNYQLLRSLKKSKRYLLHHQELCDELLRGAVCLIFKQINYFSALKERNLMKRSKHRKDPLSKIFKYLNDKGKS